MSGQISQSEIVHELVVVVVALSFEFENDAADRSKGSVVTARVAEKKTSQRVL